LICYLGVGAGMNVTLEIPDDLAAELASDGLQISRAALEALAVESFRRRVLTQAQVGRLLGLSRIQTEDFLAQHAALHDYDPGELQRESESLERASGREATSSRRSGGDPTCGRGAAGLHSD